MKKATRSANINATLYDGDFQVGFDCVGVEACRFVLCSLMPPDGSEECTYREYGSCLCPPAKYAALEALKSKVTKQMKQIKEDFEG